MEIIKIFKKDWELFKEVRTRAVKDCPQAFSCDCLELATYDKSDWERLFDNAHIYLVVNEKRGIGCIKLFKDPADGVWAIGGLWVDPKYRNLGLGKKLMLKVLEGAKEKDIDYLELGINRTLEQTIMLYRSLGFKDKKILHGVEFGDGKKYEELVMFLSLA